jgi:hypothetical protein
VNSDQEKALAMLNENRARFVELYPNQWIAVNANGTVRAAERFELLARDIDPERFVFAFVRVGAWA